MAIASTPLLVQKSAKERRKSLQRSRSIKEDQIQVDVEIVQEPDHLRRQLTSDGDDTLNKVNSLEQDEDMTGKVSFNYYGSTNVIYKQVVKLHVIWTKENNDRYFERDFS